MLCCIHPKSSLDKAVKHLLRRGKNYLPQKGDRENYFLIPVRDLQRSINYWPSGTGMSGKKEC